MHNLIVGAGAVGQAYGLALQRAGMPVSFLVKPKHADACRTGMPVHRIQRRRVETSVLMPHQVLTDPPAHPRFDHIWLCVPTDTLDGPWLPSLLETAGDATVVSLQPGMDVRERLLARLPATRVVEGLIGLVAYQTPLPDETTPPPGVAVYHPPFVRSRFGGDDATRVRAVITALRAGGCPVSRVKDARRTLAMSSAILMPCVIALEAAGWSIPAFRSGRFLKLAARGVREAQQLVAGRLGTSPPLAGFLLRAPLLRLLWTFAPRMVPFELERYLRYHFTKVHDQSRLLLAGYLEEAARRGFAAPALSELHATVFA